MEITATQECKFTSVIRYGNNSNTGMGIPIVIFYAPKQLGAKHPFNSFSICPTSLNNR
jgi:hypothetical protein